MTSLDLLLSQLDQGLLVFAGLGTLTFAGGATLWRNWRRQRRARRIERAGSVEEWQAALRLPEPEVRQVPWLRLVGDGFFALCFAAVFVTIDDLTFALSSIGVIGIGALAWDRWLNWKHPHLFEKDEGRDELDEQYFGVYLPKEAVRGFAAAIGLVAVIVALILLLR